MKPQSRRLILLESTVVLLLILQNLRSTTADAPGTELPELSPSARHPIDEGVRSSSTSRADFTAAQRNLTAAAGVTGVMESLPHGPPSSARRVRSIIFVSVAVALGLAFGAAAYANWNLVGEVLDRLRRSWNELELPLIPLAHPGSSRSSEDADENGLSQHAALLRDYGREEHP
ncbi:hypothetical protein Vretifemale_13946 [Volvox reticuliferus]|uniref:Transmembrane protein n=1 Tax=Volvox reticuliferus TaxID=1737510 RepID=A0A8J4CNR3_9CHLO|nr:hypothetical protein Vretifemale_13946 [Volvox reticuliferus]